MREQVEYLKEHKDDEFTSTDILRLRIMPWARQSRTLIKIIRHDFIGENRLRARIEGENRQTRYIIKGKHLLNYIEAYGPFLMGTIQKPKRKIWKTKKSSK